MSDSSEPNSKADVGDATHRVRCLYCGAGNFPAVAVCWQCGRPLLPLASSSNPSSPSQRPPLAAAALAGTNSTEAAGDRSLAVKAAVTLALMFPYVAVPVGIVFLMLDDPRKTRLGWITIGWSLAGTAGSIVLFFLTLSPILALLKALLPQTGHGSGLPDMHLPGSDPSDLNFFF